MAALKFALVSDIHIGAESEYEGAVRKLSRYSIPYLKDFVAKANEFEPAFVGQLGDMIEDGPGEGADAANYRQGLQVLAGCRAPVLHVLGNHEQVNLSADALCALAGLEKPYYEVSFDACTVLVLFSTSIKHTDIHVSSEQIAWLEGALKRSEKPVLIFVHHPLDEQSLLGNVWFERYPDYCFVEERAELRRIFERSGKVCAVFGGHVHQNSVSTINGIHYITIQSLVERLPGANGSVDGTADGSADDGIASGSYALVNISGRELKVKVFGLDTFEKTLPLLCEF